VPILHRILRQQIEVFMIAGAEECCEWLFFQPVQPELFLGAAVPDAAEVSRDDNAVFFVKPFCS
jgi:hypothetical protein